MLESSLTEQESQDLAGAGGAARQGRQWRRSRALQRLAENQAPQQVADVLGCSLASVYHWAAAWQQQGHMGLAEVKPAGRTRTLDVAALRLLEQWLEADPQTHGEQTTGWTVPLLPTRLRRAFQRLGWRWKRPKSVLTRPLTKKRGAGRTGPAGARRGEGGLDRRRNAGARVSAAARCLGQTETTAGGCHQRTPGSPGHSRSAQGPDWGEGSGRGGAQPNRWQPSVRRDLGPGVARRA